MSQYIGKEKAINAVLGEPTDAHYPMWYASILSTLPAVDAVEVVRCRDCRKFKTYACRMVASGYDDFCSYGERKDVG